MRHPAADRSKWKLSCRVRLNGSGRPLPLGPAYSAWFLQTDIEGREDGAVRVSIATGVTSQGHVTVLRTPFRFAYEGIERIE
jgi:hypothetical protein